MLHESILVLDIGTSGTKAAVFDDSGHLLSEAGASYQTASRQHGWFEQSPLDWLTAVEATISQLGDVSSIALLALTGSMQNLIALGANGEPILPAMLYSDSRATSRFEGFNARMQRLDAATRVANQIDPLMCSAKLDWLRFELPHIFARVTMVHTGAKDFVGSYLTGQHGTDATSASTTGLMNLASRNWDPDILDELLIGTHQLPHILPSEAILGTLLPEAAKRLGLRAGLAVLNGVGDAGAATIGAGVEQPSQAYAYIGTTGWVARVVTARYPRAPLSVYTLAHPNPSLLIEIAPILCAGDATAWLEDICGEPSPNVEEEYVSPPLYLPYLKGERSPFHDPHVRGAFLGLDRAHGQTSLRRAVREGVALAIRHNLEELGNVEGALMVLGGGARDHEWMQILANFTEKTVALHSLPVSATAYGVAVLGARRLGREFHSASQSATLTPAPETAERTSRLLHQYKISSDFLRTWARL